MLIQALTMMAGPIYGSIQRGEVVDVPDDLGAAWIAAKAAQPAPGQVARRKVERPIQDRERECSEREAALAVRAAELEKREAALADRENQNHSRRGR